MPKSAPIPSVFRPSNPHESQKQQKQQQQQQQESDPHTNTRPLSLAELADKASTASKQIPFSNSVPINRYIAGADSLKQQAVAYQREKRNEEQFICLAKCARLLVELLPTHRSWHDADEQTRKRVRKEGQAALDSLSALKSAQHYLFEAWRSKNPNVPLEQMLTSSSSNASLHLTSTDPRRNRSNSRIESTQQLRNQKEPSIQTLLGRSSRTNPTQSLHSDHNSRSDGVDFQKPDRGDGLFGFDVRNILGFGPKTPPASSSSSNQVSEIPYNFNRNATYDFDSISTLSSRMATLGAEERSERGEGTTTTFRYPTLNPSLSIRMTKHQETQGFAPSSNSTARYYETHSNFFTNFETQNQNRDLSISNQFQMPSAQHYNPSNSSFPSNKHALPLPPSGMPIPSHQNDYLFSPSATPYSNPYPLPSGVSQRPNTNSNPSINLNTTINASVTSQASQLMGGGTTTGNQDEISTARTESGAPLRPLLIPSELIERFVNLAQRNTDANKETCGLLMGKLKNNILTITHLLIPQQTSDSDSCTTHSEEEIFLYQDSNQVSVFSWIHTHPSQSCFLSSLDLHTHASYQSMLPESIAIVVSPKSTPNLGLFRLTDGPGLEIILNCKDERSFHPHNDENGKNLPLYTDAIFGHVRLIGNENGNQVHVTDLRR